MDNQPCISVRGLRKSYGDFEAVRGIDFEVPKGIVFGLLGPNGAGKTTTIEILEGLRARTSGEVSVLGYDPGIDTNRLKERIGVCLQSTNLPDKITVSEVLELFGSFYPRNIDQKRLLQRLQLTDKSNTFFTHLSGGQKQRVAIALAMVNDPALIFFDEPTTGLDPQVRLEIHNLIQELRDAKRTILLTTHYIEEAERLCDQVAIVDQGKVIAFGSPRELKARTVGHSTVELSVSAPLPPDSEMPQFVDVQRISYSDDRTHMTVQSTHPARTLVDVVKWVDQRELDLTDIHLHRPTLEDVFIELTGKKLRE